MPKRGGTRRRQRGGDPRKACIDLKLVVDGFMTEVDGLAELAAKHSGADLVMRDMDVVRPALMKIGLRVNNDLTRILREARSSEVLGENDKRQFAHVQSTLTRAVKKLMAAVVHRQTRHWPRAAHTFAQDLKPAWEDLAAACDKTQGGRRTRKARGGKGLESKRGVRSRRRGGRGGRKTLRRR